MLTMTMLECYICLSTGVVDRHASIYGGYNVIKQSTGPIKRNNTWKVGVICALKCGLTHRCPPHK